MIEFGNKNKIIILSDDDVKVKMEYFIPEYPIPPHITDMKAFSVGGYFFDLTGVAWMVGIDCAVKEGDISISQERRDKNCWHKVYGELYKIRLQNKVLLRDIRFNESIQTDEKTRIRVTLPDIGIVNIAENTTVVFKSENILEVVKGKIFGFIKKLRQRFTARTRLACIAIRGTEFSLEVDDDITVLTVFDGEVEFSDKDEKKTVIVKKNQQLVVKPTELPSEPVQINPDMVPKW